MDFKKMADKNRKVNAIVKQLEQEDDMCKMIDIINSMDINIMKDVLKKFVFMAHE